MKGRSLRKVPRVVTGLCSGATACLTGDLLADAFWEVGCNCAAIAVGLPDLCAVILSFPSSNAVKIRTFFRDVSSERHYCFASSVGKPV